MRELCVKMNENVNNGCDAFLGFSLQEKIELCKFQLSILNPKSKSKAVLKALENWSNLLIEFTIESLIGTKHEISHKYFNEGFHHVAVIANCFKVKYKGQGVYKLFLETNEIMTCKTLKVNNCLEVI